MLPWFRGAWRPHASFESEAIFALAERGPWPAKGSAHFVSQGGSGHSDRLRRPVCKWPGVSKLSLFQVQKKTFSLSSCYYFSFSLPPAASILFTVWCVDRHACIKSFLFYSKSWPLEKNVGLMILTEIFCICIDQNRSYLMAFAGLLHFVLLMQIVTPENALPKYGFFFSLCDLSSKGWLTFKTDRNLTFWSVAQMN